MRIHCEFNIYVEALVANFGPHEDDLFAIRLCRFGSDAAVVAPSSLIGNLVLTVSSSQINLASVLILAP